MNIQTLFFFVVMSLCAQTEIAFACKGGNDPIQLEQKARAHFSRWDVDQNNRLDVEEFLMSEGYNPDAIRDPKDPKNVVAFMKNKMKSLPDFSPADKDSSGGLSYEEWVAIRPTTQFMQKCMH